MPEQLIPKVIEYFRFVRKQLKALKLTNELIYGMDEASMNFDNVTNRSYEVKGAKSVAMKSTGMFSDLKLYIFEHNLEKK